MTTLICDFQDIVGKKIDGYATLTAGKVRPSYDSPSLVVHNPTKQRVDAGQTTFVNVNPGEAVITLEWDEQSATIRFVVPESDDAVYLSDCLSGEYLDPDELELLRWSIQNQLSGAREILETAKNLGLTEINGSTEAYFTEAAEILRKALEAAHLAEQSLETIDDKVADTEGVVTDVDEAKQKIQDLLDELATLELELGGTNADLAGAVETINTLSPQVDAATQAASAATQKAQNAVNELSAVQDANAAEFNEIKKDLDSATQTAKQATDAVTQTNQQLGLEVQRILGEVGVALGTATDATNQARIANDNLETYQFQLGEIQQEQAHIIGQQAEIVGNYGSYTAELDRISEEISTAASELENLSGEQSALVTEMNTQVGSLNELTALQGAAINAAKSQADKGVTDAAAASNALSAYKKVNDPRVAAAQSAADQAALDATNKSAAAKTAAEEYAKEQAEAAQAQAEENAAAEALRVAQAEATAAKNSAATDAQAKADEAERLAKIHADAQAKSAKETAEANAAKDAATKADNARIAAEANAKVLSDKAQQAAVAAQSAADTAQAEAETARAEATSKSNAARVAAELVAKELAEQAQADAEVEAARVALEIAEREAKAAQDAAAEDATAKADAAQTAAETLARLEANAARETAEANAAIEAQKKADKAKEDAEATADTLATAAKNAAATALTGYKNLNDPKVTKAQTDASSGITKANAAQQRADKGVTDAATALARANEANNKLPSITADVSAAAQTALDAVNALPGLRTDINVAKSQADKGVTDAGAAKIAAEETARQLGTLTYPNNSLIPIDPTTGDSVWTGKFSKSTEGTWLVSGSYYNVPKETPHISVVKGQVYRAVVRLRASEPNKQFSIRIRGAGSEVSISPRYQSIPDADLPAGAIRKNWTGLSQYTVGTGWETWVCDFTLPDTIEAVRVGYVYSGGSGHVEVSSMEIFPALPSKAEVADAKSTADTARTEATTKANQALQDATSALTSYKKVNDPKVTTAQQRADKGVTDAATAKSAADTAKNRADKGVSDAATAKQVADKGVADAKEVRDTVYNSVEPGASLVAYLPGTETPIWAQNMEKAPASENPDGLKEAYVWSSMAGSVLAKNIAVTPGAEYRTTVWLKADKPNSRIYLELRDQDGAHAVRTGAIGGGGTYLIGNMTVPTEWTKYETVISLRDNVQRVRIGARYQNHANGTERNAVQYVADLRVDPVIPLQGDVEKAQQDATKGIADAKAVNDKIPDINTKISNLTKDQTALGTKAQQGIDDAKSVNDALNNSVNTGMSLITLVPGTTEPDWTNHTQITKVTDTGTGGPPSGIAYENTRPSTLAAGRWVDVSDTAWYVISFYGRATKAGSSFYIQIHGEDGARVIDQSSIEDVHWVMAKYKHDMNIVNNLELVTWWRRYETRFKFKPGTKRARVYRTFWNHGDGAVRDAGQRIAELEIKPLIPSQGDVNKLLIDTAQNHNDILKAQGDINTAQGDINRNNSAFQTWQKTINDQQAKWNTASENATAALARFAITQVEWNTLSAKATNANTKAIDSHAALFEGQHKWNTVAAAAIQTQANFATKQEEWNAVQEKVNNNFQDWQNAAKEMLTDTGKFQVLQKQFNADQKLWNATQDLVNNSQKGINALNISTNAAQNDATEALRQIVNTIYPDTDVITMDPDTGAPDWTTHSAITGPHTDTSTGQSYYQASRRVNTGGSRVVKTTPDAWYVLRFDARANKAGSRIYIQLSNGENTAVSMREVEVSHWVTSSTNNSYPIDNQELVTWWREYKVRFKIAEGHDTLKLGTIYWNHVNGSVADAQQRISNLQFYRDIPTQESVDKAQNDALEALNRFAIDQAAWNKTSKEATDALREANAAQAELGLKRGDWEKGATLAINNLQTTSTKYQQWTNGASLALANLQSDSTKFKQWTKAAGDAVDALQRAVGLERLGQSLLTWNYGQDRPNWATGMSNHYTSIPGTETVTYGITSSFSSMTTPGEFVPIIPNTPYRVKMWMMGSAGSVFVLAVTSPNGEPNPLSGGTFEPRGVSNTYLVNYLDMPTTWTLYEGTVEFTPGVTAVKIGTRYFNHSRGVKGNQYISGFEFYPDIPSQHEVDEAQNTAIDALEAVVGKEGDSFDGTLIGQVSNLGAELDHRLREVNEDIQTLDSNHWLTHYWSKTGGNWHGTDWFEVTRNSNGSVKITAKGNWVGEATVNAVRNHGIPGEITKVLPTAFQWQWGIDTNRDYTLPAPGNGTFEEVISLIINFRVNPGTAVNQPYSTRDYVPDRYNWRTLWTHTVPASTTVNADFHVGWHAATNHDNYGIRIVVDGVERAVDGPRSGVGPTTFLGNGYRTMAVSVKGQSIAAGKTVQFQVQTSGSTDDRRKIRDTRASVQYKY